MLIGRARQVSNCSSPLFSVIIPSYNHAHYLPRSLDSVLAQCGGDYEVVVVDDGSTDSTAEVVGGYVARSTSSLIYAFQEHRGLSAARNHGATHSSGEYLLFLDADDALLPNALDRFRAVIVRERALDFVWGGAIVVDFDGTENWCPPKALSPHREHNFLCWLREEIRTPYAGTVVLHRRVLNRINWPEGIRACEDRVFHAHVLALFDGMSFPEAVMKRYRYADSLYHSNPDLVTLGSIKGVALIFDPSILPQHLMNMREELLARTWTMIVHYLLHWLGRERHHLSVKSVRALSPLMSRGDLPRTLLPRRSKPLSEACLSLFSLLYRGGHFEMARPVFHMAVRTHPAHLLRVKCLRQYIRVIIRMASRSAWRTVR